MHSLYTGPLLELLSTLYVLSAVKLMMETVSYQWVPLDCLVVFAILIYSYNTCKPGTVYVGTK